MGSGGIKVLLWTDQINTSTSSFPCLDI